MTFQEKINEYFNTEWWDEDFAAPYCEKKYDADFNDATEEERQKIFDELNEAIPEERLARFKESVIEAINERISCLIDDIIIDQEFEARYEK